MFLRTLSLATAAGFLMLAPAQAGQRYAAPPPVVLSPDLTSTWTLQLQPPSTRTPRVSRSQQALLRPSRKTRKVRRAAFSQPKTALRRTIEAPIDTALLPTTVAWNGNDRPGTLIVDTPQRRLFLVLPNGQARRYAIGVGKPGFEWAGTHKVTRKKEWPSWTPPKEMIARVKREQGRDLPTFMEGGPNNPMGARALYLGSTIYRIHGTNQAWSIGKAVSSGCIRMKNEDVMDLYERVPVGATVRVI
ncbi:MAG: L,D-transpeptidase [Pseudomonadota bacterium]